MRERTAFRISVVLAAQAILLLLPAAAPAERAYDSSVTGLSATFSAAFDSQGDVWITDSGRFNPPGPRGLYEHSPYPSQTLLKEANTNPAFGSSAISLQAAVNWETDEVFVAQSNGRSVAIFDEDGTYLRTWESINGSSGGGAGGAIHVAVDNSNSASRSRVYLSLTQPENSIQAFDDHQRPVEFPATAPYIQDHRITGTPAGPFGEVHFVAVDNQGRIYVTDTVNDVVDVFESTGEFVRALAAPNAVSNYTQNSTGFGGVAVDPTNGDLFITEGLAELNQGGVREYDRWGNYLGQLSDDAPGQTLFTQGTPAVDSAGRLYTPSGNTIKIFDPAPPRAKIAYEPVTGETTESGTVHATVDPNGDDDVTDCEIQWGTSLSYGSPALPCTPDPASAPPGSNFSTPTPVSAELINLTTGTPYHYRVVVESGGETVYGADRTYTPQHVIGLRTEPATLLTETDATLNASLLGDGTATSYLFEWGKTSAYGNVSATAPGEPIGSPSGPARTGLTFALNALEPFTTYHYRVVATGGAGTSNGEDMVFTTPPGVPTIAAQSVDGVHSDRAVLHGSVTPNGADTVAHFEYVSDDAFQETGFATALQSPGEGVGRGKKARPFSASLDALSPGTLYHYRLVGVNSAGVGVPSVDRTFFTFRSGLKDICPNLHVRQQTGAALLFDCRAYELASAYYAGGYDVESDLVPGQDPFDAYPMATGPSRLLYGVDSGGIPGTGSPTNHGLDPYVATRDNSGWTTSYVGIPADNPNASAPFGSPLLEADATLDTFAFAGPDICSPCFADGKAGIPVHLPDGSLVQGMAGSLDPGAGAAPSGYVGRHLSADGTHFVFGSTSQFEPDGNSNGDVSIYVRDLGSATTRVVSKTPAGATMTGAGIGELDISSEGNRVVVGQQLSTGLSGNRYWHLYMNEDGASQSVDLTPGASAGALYNGMTADGTKVFFSTADKLTADDEDNSVDLYRADVGGGSADLTRMSTGAAGTGNTDACDPSANTVHPRWNNLASVASCDVLAVGGGGGVASDDGSVYFLSPEALDPGVSGNEPIEDAPNLYIAMPGGEPHFIRTLESSATAQIPIGEHPFRRYIGAMKSPSGVAIDNSSGDVYVLDSGNEPGLTEVQKFNSNGQLKTDFAVGGRLATPEAFPGIAVDNAAGSPNEGALFVPVPFGFKVNVYEPSGSFLMEIPAVLPLAVAIHPVNGNIYVAGLFGISVYEPNGTQIGAFESIPLPTGIAVDSTGKVFVSNGFEGNGVVHAYTSAGGDLGEFDPGPAKGVSVDPTDDHLYVDRGDRVDEFDASGQPVNAPIGVGEVANSFGAAAASGNVAVTNRASGNVALYAPAVTPSDPSVDNPLVVHSLDSSDDRRLGDFQLNPVGDHAVFTSTRSLTGYENEAHRQVYRYAAQSDGLVCASCNPTGQPSSGEATLPPRGLSVTNDGRVFFNSTEGLVDRDLNEQRDAYEWKSGEGTELISTGTAALGASLLGVSADGTDAYFFTREELVAEDANGRRVKIYDARANGGFPFVPPPVPCKASDECHGPGSVAPPAPAIGSVAGTPIGNSAPPKKCKRKKCGKRRKPPKHRKKKHGRRSQNR